MAYRENSSIPVLLIKPEVPEIELKNKKKTLTNPNLRLRSQLRKQRTKIETLVNKGKTFNVFKQKQLLLEIMILSVQKMPRSYRQLDICATM